MGPLHGLKIVEFVGLGPAPFCGMLLADLGAEVLRIDRAGATDLLQQDCDILARGRRSVTLDLKHPEGIAAARRLIAGADALIEGFRPGVMERLGLGPDDCLAVNPRLVYGRMTGWGQDGPLAQTAGHDLTYIALTGALDAIGTAAGGPVVPLNLIGDFGGGGLLLAFGLVCALLEARTSGRGQVVDAAMTDGSALLMAMIYSLRGNGRWPGGRGGNLLDGGAPHYQPYRCADGEWLVFAALEPPFYQTFLNLCGRSGDPDLAYPANPADWPARQQRLAELFSSKSRADWLALVEGSDACIAPVLTLEEAAAHPHNQARGTFLQRNGMIQPAPAPRFSRTPGEISADPLPRGSHQTAALADWGFSVAEIAALQQAGITGTDP